jgi:glycosyltransferase involved in cell wall biosynthesis
MKICWIDCDEPVIGGLTTYSEEITQGLKKRGHQILHLRFSKEKKNVYQREIKFIPFLLKTPTRVYYYLSSVDTGNFIKRHLDNFGADIIHTSLATSLYDFFLPNLCRKINIPLVGTYHAQISFQKSPFSYLSRMAYRFYAPALKKFDRVIIFSQFQKDHLQKLGLENEKVVVIKNSADTQKYSPGKSDFKKELEASFIILYLGRLDREKNVDKLIQAFCKLQTPRKTKLLIVGAGTRKKKLIKMASSNKNIIFLPQVVDIKRKIEILRGSDIFVLPSSLEGQSLALIEAASCGLACVATDVGGDREILGDCGLIIEPRNIEEQLRGALEKLLKSPQKIRSLGTCSRKRILENHSLEKNLIKLEKLYLSLLNKS